MLRKQRRELENGVDDRIASFLLPVFVLCEDAIKSSLF